MTQLDYIKNALFDGLRPEQDLTVSEWADEHRILSSVASAEPGRWRTDRFPYLREIMDSLSANSPYETVVFMKGSQIGATESGNNWIGYVIHQAPGPMLAMLPTVDMAKDNSKTRLDPLIEETPALRERVRDPRSRDSGNTTLLKEFNGGFIAMVGSNAPGPMRSKPIRYLFLDEVDAYPGDVGNEGDPVSLARARTRTFARRKIYLVSTPTIRNKSRIEKLFLETDQRRYFVPCPGCGEMQHLEWHGIKWHDHNPKTAHYACRRCSRPIYNHEKNWMLPRGEWRGTAKTTDSRTIGFHLSALYSPVGFYSWEDAVGDWLRAQKNLPELKTFVNTVLGETWEEKGDAPEWERLHARSTESAYESGTVPRGGILLVAGADIQADRIEIEVVAYGTDKRSWSVDYFTFMGDPSQPEVWRRMDALLDRVFPHESGAELRIAGIAVDSGYKPAYVYEWTRRHSKTRVFAVKGSDAQKTFFSGPKILDIRHDSGKRIYRGARLWTIGVSVIKSEIYDFLRQTDPEAYGYCNFPVGYTEEYFKQLTAETLVSHPRRDGRTRDEWKKTRERNEALDCRVYARAAISILGADRWNSKEWEIFARDLGIGESRGQVKPEPAVPVVTVSNKKRLRKLSRGISLD